MVPNIERTNNSPGRLKSTIDAQLAPRSLSTTMISPENSVKKKAVSNGLSRLPTPLTLESPSENTAQAMKASSSALPANRAKPPLEAAIESSPEGRPPIGGFCSLGPLG